MMLAALWMVLAVIAMAGMFAVCVGLVVIGVRLVERRLARRSAAPSA